MYVEEADRVGRTLLVGLAIWITVGVAVWAVLTTVLPAPPLALSRVGSPAPTEPVCKASVPIGDYDPAIASDPARRVMAAPSACGAGSRGNADQVLRAWLEGAELEVSMAQPSPPVDAALLARGADLYKAHCANCHGATGDGAGPDACALAPHAAVHRDGIFALRTTEHEALPTDDDIFRTISRGVHGTAMPPWGVVLGESDRWALVAHVKTLSKQFEEDSAPPPVELGTPPAETPQRLAQGRELYASRGCASCHGDTGHGDGAAAMALPVRPRDFTRGRFHRASSVADIHATLVTGLDGTPMASFAKVMSPDELWNVALYVHQLAPPLVDHDGVKCPTPSLPPDAQELFGIRNLLHTAAR